MNIRFPVFILFAFITLSCSENSRYTSIYDGAPTQIPENLSAIPDAIPKYEPRTRAGNPDAYEVLGKQYRVLKDSKNFVQRGLASWYGSKFHGHKTSNGEVYDMFAMTAAHKTLPIPSYVRVTNLKNNRSIVVRVNDRGPFHDNRIIDLSYTAAVKLDILKTGTGFVEIRTIEPAGFQPPPVLQSSLQNGDVIFLQIGAFSEQRNAFELIDKFRETQLPRPRVQESYHQGKPLYKVQLGPVYSSSEADRLVQNLTKQGIKNIHFVVEQSNYNARMIQ